MCLITLVQTPMTILKATSQRIDMDEEQAKGLPTSRQDNSSIERHSNQSAQGSLQESELSLPEQGSKDTEKNKHDSSDPGYSMDRLTTILTMFALCTASFLAALDMTIITTALTTIAVAFDTSSSSYSWIGSSYLLGAAASTPT